MTPIAAWPVRRLLRALHRDIGYLLFGLTAVYAVSGMAVNHVRGWNPSYVVTRQAVTVGPLAGADPDRLEAELVARLGLSPEEVSGRHRPAPDVFVLFLHQGGEARIDTVTGTGTLERYRPRRVLHAANVLHLNRLQGAWTFMADLFAASLLFLALSGLFLARGRAGLAGRGKWLVAAGILVPIAFLFAGTPRH